MPSSNISVQRDPLKDLFQTAFLDLHSKLGHPPPTDQNVLDLIEDTAEVYADAITNWFNTKLQMTWDQDGTTKVINSITIDDKP